MLAVTSQFDVGSDEPVLAMLLRTFLGTDSAEDNNHGRTVYKKDEIVEGHESVGELQRIQRAA